VSLGLGFVVQGSGLNTHTTSRTDAFSNVFCGSTAGVKRMQGRALVAWVEVEGKRGDVGGLEGLCI